MLIARISTFGIGEMRRMEFGIHQGDHSSDCVNGPWTAGRVVIELVMRRDCCLGDSRRLAVTSGGV
jgi:hypothetical protein